jgi:hypothetical protein
VSDSTRNDNIGTIWKILEDSDDDNGIVVGSMKQRTLFEMQGRGRG